MLLSGQYVDKVKQTPTPNHLYPRDELTVARESERKQIFRCVNDVRGVVLLWEETSRWQANEDHESHDCGCVVVQNSGWAVISPLADQGSEVSAAHYGFSIQIQSVDESHLRESDVMPDYVVRSMRSLHLARIAYLENVFFDTFLEKERQHQ